MGFIHVPAPTQPTPDSNYIATKICPLIFRWVIFTFTSAYSGTVSFVSLLYLTIEYWLTSLDFQERATVSKDCSLVDTDCTFRTHRLHIKNSS